MKKRLISIAIIFSFIVSMSAVTASADEISGLTAKSVYVIEKNSGRVLYQKNPDDSRPIASVTKLMSLYLVFEQIDKGSITLDDNVTIRSKAASTEGPPAYLTTGEVFPVRELIKAVAIQSANDGVEALAEYVAGSEAEFVKMMNAKAKELGMENTNYKDAAGLDNNGRSSAKDICILASSFIEKYPSITDYTSLQTATFRAGQSNQMTLYTTNKLLGDYRGVVGLKTGFTTPAGECLVCLCVRGTKKVISVLLGADPVDRRFTETRQILDYSFSNYDNVYIGKKDDYVGEGSVEGGVEKIVEGVLAEDSIYFAKKGEKDKVKKVITYNELNAPIAIGDTIGKVSYQLDGKEIATGDVLASTEVRKGSVFRLFFRKIFNVFGLDWL